MIGLDTNVIVRYLALDDPLRSERATHLFERELSRAEPGFISQIALVETAWVLERAYDVSRERLASTIEDILRTDVLVVEREQEVFDAVVALRAGGNSFADALIAVAGIRAGCATTVTFDAKAARSPGFSALESRRR